MWLDLELNNSSLGSGVYYYKAALKDISSEIASCALNDTDNHYNSNFEVANNCFLTISCKTALGQYKETVMFCLMAVFIQSGNRVELSNGSIMNPPYNLEPNQCGDLLSEVEKTCTTKGVFFVI